jgi:hypothetical protein
MVSDRKPYLIDHGAAIYAQHDWPSVDEARMRAPFQMIERHVLLDIAADIREADAEMAPRIGADAIRESVATVPDELLESPAIRADFANAEAARDRYAQYLLTRISSPRAFVDEAISARERAARMPAQRLKARR